ncbi:DUF2510 domain-containing protein [Demequina iriomotensis]|uniref:DUF2510 domain-containing protein n=1 Tax=Demequina iriomotensis TaxID=1536641 RepID=UPI0007825237|nr:DUF2510 domain-containing protein [Demequina iriomotensis]
MSEPHSAARAHPVAGWYADPDHAGFLRYWDGAVWTEHTRLTSSSEPARREPRHRLGTAAVLGIIASVALLGVALVAIAIAAEREELEDAAQVPIAVISSVATPTSES